MLKLLDNRTREEILQDGIKHAAHVCRKHAYRDFAEQNDFIRTYDNARIAYNYAVLTFRKAALLRPELFKEV